MAWAKATGLQSRKVTVMSGRRYARTIPTWPEPQQKSTAVRGRSEEGGGGGRGSGIACSRFVDAF